MTTAIAAGPVQLAWDYDRLEADSAATLPGWVDGWDPVVIDQCCSGELTTIPEGIMRDGCVLAMRRRGWTDEQIADRLALSVRTVERIRVHYNIPGRATVDRYSAQRQPRDPHPTRLDPARVDSYCQGNDVDLTGREVAAVARTLVRQGWSMTSIAKRMRQNPNAIQALIDKTRQGRPARDLRRIIYAIR